MIEFTKGYKTSDGKLVATIAEAQLHELTTLLSGKVTQGEQSTTVAKYILENKDKFVDILTTTATSKPKARSVNGGKKNRKPTVITNATVSIGSTSNATQPSTVA
jgi:hypothetical protein